MLKRLTNLLLVLAIGFSAAAGWPMHSGDSESGMMDCCKKALEQNDSPRVAAARLCCATNCNEPTSTNGNPGQSFSQTGLEPSPLLVVALPPVANFNSLRVLYAATSSTNSRPTYILNLALLI